MICRIFFLKNLYVVPSQFRLGSSDIVSIGVNRIMMVLHTSVKIFVFYCLFTRLLFSHLVLRLCTSCYKESVFRYASARQVICMHTG